MIDWNKPIKTKDGRKVRILATDRKSEEYPIVAMWDDGDINVYTEEGKYILGEVNKEDLINVPEKRYAYFNVYRNCVGFVYNSKEYADASAGSDRIAKMKIKIDETRQDW